MSLQIYGDRARQILQSVIAAAAQDVISAIQSLNNADRTGAVLSRPEGILSIYGGNDNRVWVTFRGRTTNNDRLFGTLIDESYSPDDQEIEISVGGELTLLPLYATVPKDIAIMVATSFLKNGNFPRNVVWQGNME